MNLLMQSGVYASRNNVIATSDMNSINKRRPTSYSHSNSSNHANSTIVLYSSIYIAPLNSHRQREALVVRLAPRKETSFRK